MCLLCRISHSNMIIGHGSVCQCRQPGRCSCHVFCRQQLLRWYMLTGSFSGRAILQTADELSHIRWSGDSVLRHFQEVANTPNLQLIRDVQEPSTGIVSACWKAKVMMSTCANLQDIHERLCYVLINWTVWRETLNRQWNT